MCEEDCKLILFIQGKWCKDEDADIKSQKDELFKDFRLLLLMRVELFGISSSNPAD